MIQDRKHILIKSYAIGFGLLLFALAIVYSLVKIQMFTGEKYKEFGDKRTFRTAVHPAERGNLYAADGILLATTVRLHDIYVDVKTIKPKLFNKELDALCDSLSTMFNKPSAYFEKKFRRERSLGNRYMLLVKGLDHEEYLRISNFPIFKEGQFSGGFIHETRNKRVTTIDGIGKRTIGYADQRGKAGLEGAYNHYLEGEDGKRREQHMGRGNWKPFKSWDVEPKNGADVFTTIEVGMQNVAYEALRSQLIEYQADHGCVIVMEVATGKIRAVVNLKRFEDNTVRDVRNYAVWESNEPGSTFKTLSILAGLKAKKFDENKWVETGNGTYRIHGRTVRDTHANGNLDLSGVIEQSSNVGTVKLIQEAFGAEPEEFTDILEEWKMDQPLGVDIPGEGSPVIPKPDTDSWSKISLAWMSHGYGVRLTPLQILTFYNGIANNGTMLKPIFQEKITRNGLIEQEFEPEVLVNSLAEKKDIQLIQDMLQRTVEQGTAENLFNPNYPMAGKTGTTQAEYWLKQPLQYRASFAGFFPANKPLYSCVVVIHKPDKNIGYYGGDVAGPVFRKVADVVYGKSPKKLPKSDSLKKKNLETQLAKNHNHLKLNGIMPNLKGVPGYFALSELENAGFVVDTKGAGRIVKQNPKPGTSLNTIKKITLELESDL